MAMRTGRRTAPGFLTILSSWPINEFNDGRVNVYIVRPDGTDLKPLSGFEMRRLWRTIVDA